ncbi:flavin reductase family protein [Frankia sp. CNm7]|uniref:Flavin reductase family protein n=1 Tax=Frankia nepalensis TaxID=1836974 RepID=A0A937R976_9ACTN|nr:flavin reductase family protein [Frankia nepalensis]MBL7495385.1 flavin reductase family protein [Frankia nepalensis]MBL7514785.1 flavin reductase family protein [Frankia nepalensis]MBL7520894.1 flavin reductase family protein [Frankia nepalensis]MBL7627726.1 flavin reductase family protein [Frankia nepalensis]
MTDADFLTKTGLGPAVTSGPAVASLRGAAREPGRAVPARRAPAATPSVEPETLRQAFRRHAAGVTVVTLAGPAGPVGFTATSVASLSAAPPLLSLSLSTSSSSAPALLAAETLVVHLLSAGHEQIAQRFATSGVDRFAPPIRWSALPTGEPVLSDVAVWLRARIDHRITAGQSYLVVAEVVDSRVARADEPLVYHDGRYGTIADAEPPSPL